MGNQDIAAGHEIPGDAESPQVKGDYV